MKKYTVFILVVMIAALFKVNAQQSDKLKQLFLDGEYFFLYEDYEEALYSYNTLYKRGYDENGNINYRIGQCYLNISGEKDKAIPYLEKAIKSANAHYTEGSFKEVNAPLDSWFYLGIAYRINNQLDKAVSCFDKFKEVIGSNDDRARRLADKEILACNYALLAMKNPKSVTFTNVGRPISTNSKDFFPVVSGDESVIVYNSAQKFYTAVLFSKKVNNKWTPALNITPEIQSDGNQFVSSISFDGRELYLRNEDNFQADIYMSKYEDGRWNKSKPLNKNINSKYFEGNACVSKDGNTLYFSSNRTGGFGDMDIYKSVKLSNGEWGPAENLGSVINSDLNDDAPFISEDGKKLFFTSQNHSSMGGYDIYYSVLGDDGKWTDPQNMGYPLNNTDDNAFFQPVNGGVAGYISMYSKNGMGKEDIFRLSISDLTDTVQKPDTIISNIAQNKIKEVERVLPPDVEKALTESMSTAKDTEKIVIRTLFFDFNSAYLTPGSIKELNHLALVLSNYQDVKIELIGNTDALGNADYNKKLSIRRANSAKKYLISRGISGDRIYLKGNGESNFIAINKKPSGADCPEGRKYNRRVEIHVMDISIDNIIIEKIEIPENLQIK
jgi:outer membrane protein OmpA-like peptidoglycan-associated protein/tetratricopeptide (TPR) repeat protein